MRDVFFCPPGPETTRSCWTLPSFETAKVYVPDAKVVFGSWILNSDSLTATRCADEDDAAASPFDLPKISTAASMPTKSATTTTRKTGSPRPGNCGHRLGLERAQIQPLVGERRQRGADHRPEVPDPAVAPRVLNELGAEGARRVHRGSRIRPAHEDVERDREADREARNRAEGATRIGGGGKDHPDQEEGQHDLDHEPLARADPRADRGDAELDGVGGLLGNDTPEQQRAQGPAGELCRPVG